MIDEVRDYLCSKEVQKGGYSSERDLAKRFDAKRGTIREFLLTLEGEGVLERVPRKGYKLIDYEVDDKESVEGMRYCVERLAAKKAIKNATREDILRMILICEDMEKYHNPKDISIYVELEISFHRALVAASHNELLKKLYSLLTLPFFCQTHEISPKKNTSAPHRHTREISPRKNKSDSHRHILEALRNRDLKALNHAIDSHLRNPFKED